MILAGVLIAVRDRRPSFEVNPIEFQAPSFSLTDRSGRTVTDRDLAGKIWIADFIYTTCPGPCPVMSGVMKKLADRWRDRADIRFVSFTVDPETDTPVVLADYAARLGASSDRWFFLTGPAAEMKRIALEGFRLGYGENPDGPASTDGRWIHSTRLVVVGEDGKISGYYDGMTEEGLEKLIGEVEKKF